MKVSIIILCVWIRLRLGRDKEEPGDCHECITWVQQGQTKTKTLQPEGCSFQKECEENKQRFQMCRRGKQVICYDPKKVTKVTVIQVSLSHITGGKVKNIASQIIQNYGTQAQLKFDVCQVINNNSWPKGNCGGLGWERHYMLEEKYLCAFPFPEGHNGRAANEPECDAQDWNYCPYWKCVTAATWTQQPMRGLRLKLQKGVAQSDCKIGECNPVIMTLTPVKPLTYTYGILIYGKGSDPGAIIRLEVKSIIQEIGEERSITWSVYETLKQVGKKEIVSTKAQNLFVEMAEGIAKTLAVRNCFVCGGTNMGEKWPWEAKEAGPVLFNNLMKMGNITQREMASDIIWTLTTNLVANVCFRQNGTEPVGDLMCKGVWDGCNWTSPNNEQPKPEPYNMPLRKAGAEWVAPENMYWICGNQAYEKLPGNWSGTCMFGWIRPSFFLLPMKRKQVLGIPVYDEVGKVKRSLAGTKVGTWKDDEWPPERIIAYYDPATWAEDGSWGYRTPIYMINRMIRLQAVLEIAGRRIDAALNVIAGQQDKLRTAVYQNRLALDYILAKEGGVCGKFNLTNCCLEIDETGKVVADLTADLRKLVHVPVQTWKGALDVGQEGFLGGYSVVGNKH
ncbi:endogenous retrovirus group 3 member 1 Env polyprotein [Candoia aspera]|uniref:endogenous retrovirus group 3 member 1 Env polyprotein n=1 Tax=Candoia aspera TaxID=51853 RepID=UPI002FD827EC